MKKVSVQTIQEITAQGVDGMSDHDRDEMAIPTYTHGNPLIRWLMWRRYQVIERMARLRTNTRVLEFGCGVGLFLPTLSGAGRTVQAIDLFPQFAKALSDKLELGVTFPEKIEEVPDDSLDLLVAADVLEHVDDLPGWVRTFRGKIKNDGAVLVSGPTENIAYRIGRYVAGFSDKADYHHTDIDDIGRVFQENGFRLVKQVSLPFALPPHLFKIFRFEPE